MKNKRRIEKIRKMLPKPYAPHIVTRREHNFSMGHASCTWFQASRRPSTWKNNFLLF